MKYQMGLGGEGRTLGQFWFLGGGGGWEAEGIHWLDSWRPLVFAARIDLYYTCVAQVGDGAPGWVYVGGETGSKGFVIYKIDGVRTVMSQCGFGIISEYVGVE